MIFSIEEYDSAELSRLSTNSAVFKPYRAGLMIKNFRILTDYDYPYTDHALLEPIRVDTKTVGMIDCDLRIQGTIMFAETTVFNWHMENVIFETQHLYRLSFLQLT